MSDRRSTFRDGCIELLAAAPATVEAGDFLTLSSGSQAGPPKGTACHRVVPRWAAGRRLSR